MQKRYGMFILWGLVLLAGCTGSSKPFTDDFSDPASGWGAASTETFVRGYDSGKYLIRLDAPHWFAWTTADRNYADVAVEVTVRSEGASDNHFGLFCRYSEAGFYYFAASSDGYYAIFRRVKDGPLEALTGPAMLRTPLLRRGGSDNQLLAVCQGNELAFYINGEQVTLVEDDTFDSGDIGMAAGSAERGEATLVWFDDLAVTEP